MAMGCSSPVNKRSSYTEILQIGAQELTGGLLRSHFVMNQE
jgi:hypothetical protein